MIASSSFMKLRTPVATRWSFPSSDPGPLEDLQAGVLPLSPRQGSKCFKARSSVKHFIGLIQAKPFRHIRDADCKHGSRRNTIHHPNHRRGGNATVVNVTIRMTASAL